MSLKTPPVETYRDYDARALFSDLEFSKVNVSCMVLFHQMFACLDVKSICNVIEGAFEHHLLSSLEGWGGDRILGGRYTSGVGKRKSETAHARISSHFKNESVHKPRLSHSEFTVLAD